MKRAAFLICICLFVSVVHTPAFAQRLKFGHVTAYTRNLYIGAAVSAILEAPPEALLDAAQAAFAEIENTNFLLRAEVLADEMQESQPHLIGLQEVFRLALNGDSSMPPFLDYLDTLLEALDARKLDYRIAAVVNNPSLTFNVDLFPPEGPEIIEVTGRNVILARGDVTTEVVAFPCANDLDDTTDDGCAYKTLLPLPPPFSDSFVFRSFVGVDAMVRGKTYRFVTTHLETPRAGGNDITFLQQAQAAELVGAIIAETPPKRPVILAGDFNSGPMDLPGSAYDIIRSAGYADTWKRNIISFFNPDGFTCCQDNDLNNDESLLDLRIDHIFVKNNLGFLPFSFTGPVFARIIGDERIGDSQPKWSADHAGPFVVLPRIPLFK